MTTHTLTLHLDRPPMTSNDQRRAHWTKVRAAKAEAALFVRNAAVRSKLKKFEGPVTIAVTWFAPNAIKRDSDSLGPFVKAALDALVRGGWLIGDSWQHVTSTSMAVAVDRARPRIEVTITEVDA